MNMCVCTYAHTYIYLRVPVFTFAVNLRAALKGKLNCVHCAIYKSQERFLGMTRDVVGV